MSDGLAWVVGAGGLLGSHVLRAIPLELPGVVAWDPGPGKISWHDPSRALSELADHVEGFSRAVAVQRVVARALAAVDRALRP